MKNLTLEELLKAVGSEQGSLRLHQRGVIENLPSLFVVGLACWSLTDVALGNILYRNRQRIEAQGVVVEIFDMDAFAPELEEMYSPLINMAKIGDPIVGYWQSANLEWVECSFVGAQRILEFLQIPVQTLRDAFDEHDAIVMREFLEIHRRKFLPDWLLHAIGKMKDCCDFVIGRSPPPDPKVRD